MACGAVAVSTDVGDTCAMLDGCGIITTNSPVEIAGAWQEAYARRRDFALQPEHKARFSRDHMVAEYRKVIEQHCR